MTIASRARKQSPPMNRQPAILAVVVALAGTGATCKGRDQSKPALSTESSAIDPGGPGVDETPPVTEIEGVDLLALAPEVRGDALRLLNENYCYCGCPRTIAACLADREACTCVECSERMANFLLDEFKDGADAQEVEMMMLDGFSEGYNGQPVKLDATDQPIKGAKDARFTVSEFADFRCPHCAAASEMLTELVAKHPDVRLVYYYFPIGNASESIQAAEAAEEARAQGKYWEMSDTLFRNQHALTDSDLLKYARDLGLDVVRFEKALKTHIHRDRVLANKRLGESIGVMATPSLFVDGRKFGLSRRLRNLELRIEMERERGQCK